MCLSRHANYASCLPAYTSEVLEALPATLPAGMDSRAEAAEELACRDLKQTGWECRKLLPRQPDIEVPQTVLKVGW